MDRRRAWMLAFWGWVWRWGWAGERRWDIVGERRNENENELGLFFLLAFWTPWDILEWTYRTGSRRPYLTTPERSSLKL